jgi:hypothetical protein
MKKILKIPVLLLVLGLVLGLIGCGRGGGGGGDEYDQYYDGSFRNNRNGTVDVENDTSHDMLLFTGGISNISLNNIVGGVRAGSTNTVNFSAEHDYAVGGYKVIHAVKQDEFINSKGQQLRVDHSQMITYRGDARFKINIVSTTDGTYQYMVLNMNSQYALELRKNSPDGEKVAYLTRAEKNRVIKTPSNTPITVFPVWIAFNNITKSIVSFSPSDAGDSWEGERDIQPRSPTGEISTYRFPDSQIDIAFNISFPFATVQVRNNAGRDVVFRIANQDKTPESGYRNITSGARETYEIISDGEGLNLNLSMQSGRMVIPVRFEATPNVLPVLENGYVYSVNLQLVNAAQPSEASSYQAWLVKGAALSKSDLLTSASD